jgi:predicted ATPase
MQLEFRQPHLSITAFPTIDVPQLTIIVGLNGSGKSHLLQAIDRGAITNEVTPSSIVSLNLHQHSDIRLIANGSPPALFEPFVSNAPAASQVDLVEIYEQRRSRILSPFFTRLEDMSNGAIGRCLSPNEDLWRVGPDVLSKRTGIAIRQIDAVFSAAENELRRIKPGSEPGFVPFGVQNQWAHDQNEAQIVALAISIADRFGSSMLDIQQEQLRLHSRWGETDQFSLNLPLIFGNYRDALARNHTNVKYKPDIGLDDEVFAKRFGQPPWDEINRTLKDFALPYEVTSPDPGDQRGRVSVALRKSITKDIVSIDNLSSGEKILFQLALSTFQSDEALLTVRRPKLLLLDEMDASLHPEMVHRWLGAIQHSLVEGQGLHCIITTHSPTTVALAPEESLFEMVDGRSGLKQVSKQHALNRLTFGVPTLSIDYSGRRQVFTESDTDAYIYERIYALIKSRIDCKRELNFLSTGVRLKNNNEINTGCTIVNNTVEKLAELQNTSIFGITDWDLTAKSTDRVKVIAENERYSIENVILDPLLVAFLLLKYGDLPKGLEDFDRFLSVPNLAETDLQRLIDAIQGSLFPKCTNLVEVSYIGGKKLNVSREYLEIKGHELEEKLFIKLPKLKKWTRDGKGKLIEAVINHVLPELPEFCPVTVKTVFESIANEPTPAQN